MTTFKLRASRLACSGLLFALLAGALPALAAPDKFAQETASMAKELHTGLARSFVLPKELKLEPALRAEAEAMAAAHLERMKQLLPAWIDEERRLQTTPKEPASPSYVFFAVNARMLNELALWQVAAGDAAYEQATLAALQSPRSCQVEGNEYFQDFASRVVRLQAMPSAQRKAALDSERRLLALWGKPRADVPPWPLPLPQDAAMQAVEQIRRGGARPAPALAPKLAYAVLSERMDYAKLDAESICLLQQWWLRASLAQGAAPAAALSAFRYATLITATDRFGNAFETADAKPGAAPAYPKLAQRFIVTGTVRIRRPLDASGKRGAFIVGERKITVNGIRGTRPVAFENALDAASLQRAALVFDKPESAAQEYLDMVWTLEDPEPSAPANPPKKAKP